MSLRSLTRCPITGKRVYANKQDAKIAAEDARRGLGIRTIRAYRCEICQAWHITKMRTHRKPRRP
jgi:hypothetical protein